jgi:hypothetical protein
MDFGYLYNLSGIQAYNSDMYVDVIDIDSLCISNISLCLWHCHSVI